MDSVIKSFEEGADIVGDILTGGKKKQKVKIGLLTCGYFEYWRMYPQLKQLVQNDLQVVIDNITSKYENVVLSGMVDTLDSADKAGRLFKKEDVDVVLMVYGTYTADFISLTALEYVAQKPLIIFSMQVHENVDANGTYLNSLQNSGIIGVSQLTGTLRKMKRDYKIVVGSKNDSRSYSIIYSYLNGLQGVLDLRESNVGMIGHVFRGMYDIEISKTFLKSTFGVNMIMIQNSHLLDIWNDVTPAEVDAETDELINRFKTKNVTIKDVKSAIKLAIAMRKIAKKFNLDAMCFLDQHYVQKHVLTTARIGASLLMEKTDMVVNCEGDLGGLVAMMLMKSISKRSPLMAEWGEYDQNLNSCLMIGHGIGTPDLAKSEDDVTLTRTPEEWGFEGAGLNYELIVKPGKVTLSHLMESPTGYRMLIAKAESIEYPKLNFDELHAMVRVKSPIKEFLEKVFEYGVSHHCIVGIGDISSEMSYAAQLLKIEKFEIE